MPKVLKCGDVMPGCGAVIEGPDEVEVMRKAMEHAKTVHRMVTISADLATRVRAAIKNK